MAEIPGVVSAVEQPISHLISHMLSGVKAQVGIKIYGDDLDMLRHKAEQVKADIEGIRGVKDLIVEQQTTVPQLRIELDRDQLLLHGLSAVEVNDFIETAMNGVTVSRSCKVSERSTSCCVWRSTLAKTSKGYAD